MISELTLFVFNLSWLSNKEAFEAAAKSWKTSIIFILNNNYNKILTLWIHSINLINI